MRGGLGQGRGHRGQGPGKRPQVPRPEPFGRRATGEPRTVRGLSPAQTIKQEVMIVDSK